MTRRTPGWQEGDCVNKRLLSSCLLTLLPAVALAAGPQWIWSDTPETAQQVCLRTAFQAPAGKVAAARLWITADNAYRAWLNGHPVGRVTTGSTRQPTTLPRW